VRAEWTDWHVRGMERVFARFGAGGSQAGMGGVGSVGAGKGLVGALARPAVERAGGMVIAVRADDRAPASKGADDADDDESNSE
jgi:hypothetical protein